MKKELFCLIILSLLLASIVSKESFAAPYYEGKTITIIVGYKPGGGYDRIARLLAKHLPRYIPGKPAVIIENMEGAASIMAANYLYNVAKPDGLTIGTFDRGIPFAQLTKVEGVKYDVNKFSWIGSAAVESTVLVLRNDLPYKTFDDVLRSKEPVYLGTSGQGTMESMFTHLLKEFAGLNFKMVIYPSSSDSMLAIEQKEIDGKAGSLSSFKPFMARGVVRPMVRGRVGEPGAENLPVDENLTQNKKGKTLMAMRSAPDRIGRPYMAPPKTSPEVMYVLRDAFAKVSKDPELLEDAKKFMFDMEYVPADECMKVLNFVFSQPEDIVKDFSRLIKF